MAINFHVPQDFNDVVVTFFFPALLYYLFREIKLDAAKGYMLCHAIDPSEQLPSRTSRTGNNSLFHPLMTKPVSSTWYPVLSFLVPPEVKVYDKDSSQSGAELVVSKEVRREGWQMLRERLTEGVSQRSQCQGSAWDRHSSGVTPDGRHGLVLKLPGRPWCHTTSCSAQLSPVSSLSSLLLRWSPGTLSVSHSRPKVD